jgi:hypothetical protein
MTVDVVVVVLGAVAGFVLSRWLRTVGTPRPARADGPVGRSRSTAPVAGVRAASASSLARDVGGALGRRRGLTPPELQRACFSEMVRHVQVTRDGRTVAPSRYTIRLHPDDLDIVEEGRRWFTGGLERAMIDAAKAQGWRLDGPLQVAYEPDPSRRPGVPTALAVAPGDQRSGPVAAPNAAGPPTAGLVAVRSDSGARVPLVGPEVTIGRSRDRDISIDDSRISRAHAHLEARARGWVVIDDGSANGTTVDGRPLNPHEPAPIRAGSVVAVGPFELRITGRERAAEPGTRALDDSDRNRISREYLPSEPNR